jgi:hypothetical protein
MRIQSEKGGHVMKKILQIMPACDGWEAVFFNYDDGELFCDPVICWALVSERPYDNGLAMTAKGDMRPMRREA